MRLIKMLGLAMVAAIAAMAFVGAGSASATSTALCKTHPEGAKCKAGTQLSGLLNVDGLQILGEGVLTTSLGSIQCPEAHIKAHIPNSTLASSILGIINEFSYLGCTSSLFGCSGKPATVTTTVKPEFHLLYLEPNLGDLTVLKPSTEVKIPCGGIIGTITCKFAENDSVVGKVHNLHEGKVLPVVKIEKAPIKGPGGGLCPTSGTLTTTFDLTYLEGETKVPLFIAT